MGLPAQEKQLQKCSDAEGKSEKRNAPPESRMIWEEVRWAHPQDPAALASCKNLFLKHHQPGHRTEPQTPLSLRLSCNLGRETLYLSLRI